MSAIDVDQLLREVSAELPCGGDLEYDPAYLEMTRLAAGKPAQQIGSEVLAGEEPDWRAVRDRCVELLGRSKDLRIAVMLARALARTDGLPGFGDGLALTQGLVERYWPNVHPKLDPDDGNDPTMRINSVAALADRDQTVSALRAIPLANSRRAGRYGLRDFDVAIGTLPKPAGTDSVADLAMIEAAFLDMDSGELEANARAVKAALEHVGTLDSRLTDLVGAGASADFTPLSDTLKSMNTLLQQQLGRRGMVASASATEGAQEYGGDVNTETRPAMSGSIQSREDVIRVLDQVTDWYSKYEPSSPVPLLLQRAKRLVNKSFLEAVQDLSPSGLTEIQSIAGVEGS